MIHTTFRPATAEPCQAPVTPSAKQYATSEPTSPDPSRPTRALPGSIEKERILAARAALKLPLFHPLDATNKQAQASTSSRSNPFPRGVSWSQRNQRWRARAWDSARGKTRYLGLFDSPELASQAVRDFASRIQGTDHEFRVTKAQLANA